MNSELFKLKLNDFAKGLVVAFLAGAILMLNEAFTSECGVSCIDWQNVLNGGIGSMVAYLIKNYLSDEDGKFAGVL